MVAIAAAAAFGGKDAAKAGATEQACVVGLWLHLEGARARTILQLHLAELRLGLR